MRFFIPEWDDQVDPSYDFVSESHSSIHKASRRNDVYMWEIFQEDTIPFDGILVSLMNLLNNSNKISKIKSAGNIHNYLRLPKRFPVLADCGAWGYIKNEDNGPPFNATEVLDIYRDLGVQEAVTVDHLVLPQIRVEGRMVPVDVDKRMRITFQNGVDGYKAWKEDYSDAFDLLVGVQGLSSSDYFDMLKKYLEHGITTFAFGGLAKKPTKVVLEIIDSLLEFLKNGEDQVERIHFFGLGRMNLFPKFREVEDLGVDISFDTSSWLRQAWLGGKYFIEEGNDLKSYTAIRVPGRSSFKGSKKLLHDADVGGLEKLENETMKSLRRYDENNLTLDETLKAVQKYDDLVLYELKRAYERNMEESEEKIRTLKRYYEKLEKQYFSTLKNRPWTVCDCPICRDTGIEVMIFRGNNRNRRRGFHNTYIMFNKVLKNPEVWEKKATKVEKRTIAEVEDLIHLSGKVLVITGCTKSKLGLDSSVAARAEDMYTGRLFKAVRFYAKVKQFPYVIVSAKYGLLHPEDVVEGYENVLRTNDDVARIKPRVSDRLIEILAEFDKILVIAGKRYRDVLEDVWDERFMYVKSRGYADLARIVNRASVGVTTPKLKFYIENG